MRKVITDIDDIRKIFTTVHDNRGHLKLTTACQYINTQFYIYNLWSLLKEYIQTCDSCQNLIHYPINNHHFFPLNLVPYLVQSVPIVFTCPPWVKRQIYHHCS